MELSSLYQLNLVCYAGIMKEYGESRLEFMVNRKYREHNKRLRKTQKPKNRKTCWQKAWTHQLFLRQDEFNLSWVRVYL